MSGTIADDCTGAGGRAPTVGALRRRRSSCREDPEVIKQILDRLDRKMQAKSPMLIPEGRAPPSFWLFD